MTKKYKSVSVLFILIGVSLVVAVGFLIAFLWAVKKGQYEDDYTPSVRMLFDEKPQKQVIEKTNNTNINI